MRVVHLNTFDVIGGAARAAYRLHLGLQSIGVDSRMLSREKTSEDTTVCSASADDKGSKERIAISNIIHSQLITPSITSAANTIFTVPFLGFDVSAAEVVASADIVNLHWVANYLSPLSISKLVEHGKRLVWTLHDQWPFTGGCHYSNGCTKYEGSCELCPQIDLDLEIAAAVLDERAASMQSASVTVVAPSRWMRDLAKKSRVFKDKRIEYIPYSLEVDKYINIHKHTAKANLGIDSNVLTLLFAAHNLNERRKGYREFLEVLNISCSDSKFIRLINENRIQIIVFGHANNELLDIGIPILSLGYIESDYEICNAYSAADLFVMTSLEDNLPNTILESMCCGTPVLSFSVGGIPDMVKDEVTGKLIDPFDTVSMANSMIELLLNNELLRDMSNNCRVTAESCYSLGIQANRYRQLYEDIVRKDASLFALDYAEEKSADASIGNVYNLSVEKERGEYLRPVYSQLLEKLVLTRCIEQRSDMDPIIAKLQDVTAELERIKSSGSWRATAWVRNLLDALRSQR